MEHNAGTGLLASLEASGLGETLRSSLWLYPAVETLHILGMALLVGSIVAFDLKVLAAGADEDLRPWRRHLVPIAIAGFVLAVPMGFCLFAAEATAYAGNPVFLAKMTLLVLGLVNVLLFRRIEATYRFEPHRLRASAGASLVVWVLVLVCGRMIAYV